MRLLLVSVCLAIFSLSFTSGSEPHYMISVPINLAQGTEEKVCVTFLNLKGAVDLTIELKKDDQVHIVAEDKIDGPDHSKCYHFQVPIVEEKLSIWSLHVTAHGDHIVVDESKKVVLMQMQKCIIQTEKPNYKPGDTVRFQLISVDHHIHASDETFPLVEIIDPNNHRIAQWLNVSTKHGFAGFNFHLADEIPLGKYKINLPDLCTKDFKVEEYVLKRFEVIITSPPSVTLLDKSFNLEACGRYTYGRPVEGSIDLNMCLKLIYYRYNPDTSGESEQGENCINIKNVKTDTNGCLSKDISLGLFKISKLNQYQLILIKSIVTEDHTGRIEKAFAEVKINTHKRITFFERMGLYKKGLPYHTKVKVTDEKKQPMPNKVIYLYEGRHSSSKQPHTSVTDDNGIAHFVLNTSTWEYSLELWASLSSGEDDDRYFDARTSIMPIVSQSESHLSIEKQSAETECNSDQTVTVKYDIHRKNLDSDTDHLHFFSMLRSKSGIISYKDHKIDIKDQANNPTVQGSFPISFHTDADLFPDFLLLVFSLLPNGETIAHIEGFKTPLCANEKVQLQFSEEQVRPGASVNLKVSAKAGAYCSIRSVDKRYLLQKPHDRSLLSDFEEGFSSLQGFLQRLIDIAEDPLSNQCPENETALDEIFIRAFRLDPYSLFWHSGLKTFTNTQIKSPPICMKNEYAARSGTKLKKTGDKEKEIQESFTRRHFPDSWFFEVIPVESDGHTILNRSTPHSITKWVTDAICLTKTGFASVTGVELTTFQPYFIDLNVPYSVVQGEKFTVQAVVFSNEKKCSLIVVSLHDSEDFATVKDKEQARCVCEGHLQSFTWDVTAVKPKTLKVRVDSGTLDVEGKCTDDPLQIRRDHRDDSVEKTIVVKPRGREEEKTQTFIIYPPENKEDIHITLNHPERLVPGSERAHLLLQGDLMANIYVNLDNLLHIPDGCGEQNAARFLKYVYAMDYLESIHELTPEKKDSIIKSLEKAYQKQLTFRGDDDGTYGFFREDYRKNLWLTSLVVKAFSKAQKWIYIDEKDIQESVKWIQSLQQPDGCFEHKGQYFNNKLKVDNDAGRTAFILISLLENQKTHSGSIVENALNCLRKPVDSEESVHTLALMAYAFTLSGDSELRDQMLKKLDEKSFTKEGRKHWKTNPQDPDDVETLAYILLALLSDKTVTTKNLEESTAIIHALVTLQNPYGGFQSSQDTTVAIQALAKYAKAINHKKADSTLTIKSKSGFQKIVHVDKSNSLLVQTVDLPEIPGEYTVNIAGDGFVYLQLHLHYYTFPDASDKDYFSLNVSTEPSACTHESQKKFDVHVDVRYSGKRENTNMALILIEPTSGYIPDKNSLEKLKQLPGVRRTEVSAEKVSIYLDELTHATESFVLSLEKESHVENLQPATVVVHDYYFPEEHSVAEYNAPCSGGFKKTEAEPHQKIII